MRQEAGDIGNKPRNQTRMASQAVIPSKGAAQSPRIAREMGDNVPAPPGALGCSAFSPETTNLGKGPETGVPVYREILIGTKLGRTPG